MADKKRESMASKIDEVARNQIWREHLKKEYEAESALTPFQLNPKTRAFSLPVDSLLGAGSDLPPRVRCSQRHHAEADADPPLRLWQDGGRQGDRGAWSADSPGRQFHSGCH